jgi:hypothetical protein
MSNPMETEQTFTIDILLARKLSEVIADHPEKIECWQIRETLRFLTAMYRNKDEDARMV